ncbi:MAG TPA: hypothetical protein VL361_18455 [Candidatus Limnocylindrales bacterium]|jgi:hypothetical protein|nr:hypothetical protein [Candidatus Limnocylindrales bacterium]
MASTPSHARPPFDEAVNAWKSRLGLLGLPTNFVWIFDENLCFEKFPNDPAGFRLGYQLIFTPPPPNAERIAYDHFSEFSAPLVFYRVGTSNGKSVCLLLCDKWFEQKTEKEGYSRRDDWLMAFRPGGLEEIEEIKDKERWKNRILRDRPLHDLDFCMTLQGVHETLAHGRVLTAYERYALKFLHGWRRFLRTSEQ